MIATALLLDPNTIITAAGPWALLVVSAIILCETGLLVGFFLPGDTLLFFTGVLVFDGAIPQPLWLVMLSVIAAAVIGDQIGFTIGRRGGPAVFERRESGLFSRATVARTERFFDRFGMPAVTIARFVPVVRTFAPVMAGIGRMKRRRFFAYNLAGGIAWSVLVIGAGFLLGQIPGVSDFVRRYIDVILLGIILVSVTPIVVQTVRTRRRSAHSDSPS